jgi:acyl carrier protein
MHDEIFIRLKNFIIMQSWEYDFPLTRTTTVENDLMITGDDAVDFLVAYGKEFNVDLSNFMAADYFDGEGMDILGLRDSKKKKILTIGHLENGIIAGRLNEEIINS